MFILLNKRVYQYSRKPFIVQPKKVYRDVFHSHVCMRVTGLGNKITLSGQVAIVIPNLETKITIWDH